MKNIPEQTARGRGERGAALITALLMTTLLLSAGGALILTAGMATTTAADSTAEMQAYYAAEAGLETALAVLRRQVPSTPTAGTTATFRQVICGSANTGCTNSGRDFSTWLTYNSAGVITVSASPATSFSLTVRDAAVAADAGVPDSPYSPRYLVVTARGYGPKGAKKVLEMTVDRLSFSYDAPAALVLRESKDANPHVKIEPGPGKPNNYSGTDFANPSVMKPAVGVGQTSYSGDTDLNVAGVAMKDELMTGGVGAVGTASTPWPPIVSDAATTYKLVHGDASTSTKGFADYATSTTCPANSTAIHGFVYVNGDCSLGTQNSGDGFLVVTGTLTLNGDFSFSGVIFALGDGKIIHKGGGGSVIEGGILAAGFTGNGSAGYTGVDFDTSGGGNSTIRYNSQAIENALAFLGPRVLGVVEK